MKTKYKKSKHKKKKYLQNNSCFDCLWSPLVSLCFTHLREKIVRGLRGGYRGFCRKAALTWEIGRCEGVTGWRRRQGTPSPTTLPEAAADSRSVQAWVAIPSPESLCKGREAEDPLISRGCKPSTSKATTLDLCRVNRFGTANTDNKPLDQPVASMGHTGDEQEQQKLVVSAPFCFARVNPAQARGHSQGLWIGYLLFLACTMMALSAHSAY